MPENTFKRGNQQGLHGSALTATKPTHDTQGEPKSDGCPNPGWGAADPRLPQSLVGGGGASRQRCGSAVASEREPAGRPSAAGRPRRRQRRARCAQHIAAVTYLERLGPGEHLGRDLPRKETGPGGGQERTLVSRIRKRRRVDAELDVLDDAGVLRVLQRTVRTHPGEQPSGAALRRSHAAGVQGGEQTAGTHGAKCAGDGKPQRIGKGEVRLPFFLRA